MRHLFRVLALTVAAAGLLVFPLGAGAGHTTDPHTPNLVPRGHILEPASLLNPAIGNPDVHTDIAFWGKFAIQGNWDGFNIRDIRNPDSPKQVGRAFCDGGQGDVVVYKNIVVRTWDAPASGTTMCGGQPVPAGFEGIHVFDISDMKAPELVGLRRPPVRDAHRDRRARQEEQAPADLQLELEHSLPVARHHRSAAQGPGRSQVAEERADRPHLPRLRCDPRQSDEGSVRRRDGRARLQPRRRERRLPGRSASCSSTSRSRASRSATRPRGRGTARSSSSGTSPAAVSRPSVRRPTRSSSGRTSSTTVRPARSSASGR